MSNRNFARQVLNRIKLRDLVGHDQKSRLAYSSTLTCYGTVKMQQLHSRAATAAIALVVFSLLLTIIGAGSALASGNQVAVDQSDAHPSLAALGITSGRIAFASTRDGNQFIYQYDFNANKIQKLTDNPGDYGPAWSPDGKQIAYISPREGANHVFVMKADGSDPRQIAPGADVSWSPDGKRIAFSSDQGKQWDVTMLALIIRGPLQVYSMNLDGSGLQRLTKTATVASIPNWSPDGKQITYSFFDGAKPMVYVMSADGSNPRALSKGDAAFAGLSTWSPDGKSILYVQGTLEQRDVFIMNADGSNPRNLTNSLGDNWMPTWSPDGKFFAFASNRERSDKQYDIYVQNLESGEVERITDGTGNNMYPSWGPSTESPSVASTPAPTVLGGGRGQIVFQSNRGGEQNQIFIMNSDGSSVKVLSEAGQDVVVGSPGTELEFAL